MNPVAFVLVVLFAVSGISCGAADGVPADPLQAGYETAPLAPGDLLLRELTQPPALFVWTTLKDLESLNAADLRTLAHGLWRAQRRGTKLTAAPLAIEAWAERDLAGLLNDMLTVLQWEHSSLEARGHSAGIESTAAALWCRLAEENWKQALPLLNKVSREQPALDFWLPVAAELTLPLERLPVFLTTAGKGMESQRMALIVDRVMWSAVKIHGSGAAARAAAKIKPGGVKALAEAAIRQLRNDPPFRAGERSSAGNSQLRIPSLCKLLAVDTAPDAQRRIPFKLLREILKLTAGEAIELAKQLPRENPPGHWLAWMLFMRAADDDPVLSETVSAETAVQLVRVNQPLAALYALRPDLDADTALREIRAIASPDLQRQAFGGFLTGNAAQEFITKELGNPVFGYAAQLKLPADYWRAGLCRAAVSGAGAAALRLADGLPWEPAIGRLMLKEDIVKAWALSSLSSLRLYAAELENPDEREPVSKAMAFVMPLLLASAQPGLPDDRGSKPARHSEQ